MTKPKFTYGDRIRRKTGGPVETVRSIGPTAYYFESGRFALLDDEDCYRLEQAATGFFLVARDLSGAPLSDYVSHGYLERKDFEQALHHLTSLWGGRIGEVIDERHDFLRLKFRDMPGRRTEEAWLPLYLLQPCPIPDYLLQQAPDPIVQELDDAFGFEGPTI